MQGSTALKKAFREGSSLETTVRCFGEWNLNRYGNPTVDNAGFPEKEQGYNTSAFPIESIVNPIRPRNNQLVKARVTSRSKPLSVEGKTGPSRISWPRGQRAYTVGTADNTYKNWSSPDPSATTGSGGAYAIANVNPQATYDATYSCNKVTIVFADIYAKAKNYVIQLKINNVWTTIATNLVSVNGLVEIYLQNNGTWSTTVNRANSVKISGVGIKVTALDKPDAYLQVIEVSARFERELTNDLIGYSVSHSMSEESFVAPLGRASANTANITLSNIAENSDVHGAGATNVYKYNSDNAASDFFKIIDANVLMWVDIGVNTTGFGGSGIEWVRQFTMYTESWSGQQSEQVTVSLKDSAMHLANQLSPEILLENVTIAEAIWRLCDMIGFTNFAFEYEDYPYGQQNVYLFKNYGTMLIPYFWTDREKSIWEMFSEMAEATQTAIYFDEYNRLKIKTRAAFDDELKNLPLVADTADATFRSVDRSANLANVVNVEAAGEAEANTVNVVYKPTSISKQTTGLPAMEIMWEADNQVLRASPLAQSLGLSSAYFTLSSRQAAYWPYVGLVNIEGEYIRYKGKQYAYYNTSGALVYDYVESQEEKDGLDTNSSPTLKWKNFFTGRFLIEERGCFISSPRYHNIDFNGYSGFQFNLTATTSVPVSGQKTLLKEYSQIELQNSTRLGNVIHSEVRGSIFDASYAYYGTRIMFPKNTSAHSAAGLCFATSPTGESGYYVELGETSKINRKHGQEVSIIVKYSNGTYRKLGAGRAFNIAAGVFYDLDIIVSGTTDQHIDIWINGTRVYDYTVPQAWKPPAWYGGRFGMFVRGMTTARFEYLYAHASAGIVIADDYSSFLDRVRGGVASQFDKEYQYWTRNATMPPGTYKKKPATRYTQKYNQIFVDDFGPYVHEVREYDIKFEKGVATNSYLYISNDSQIACPEYNSTPYGAKFMIGNYSRKNAVLAGDDNITYGTNNTITQRAMIYGRHVIVKDDQKITVKNDSAVKRRGEQSLEVESPWIQTKETAQSMANWIVKKWSLGEARYEVEVFGNPLVNIADIVLLDHPNTDIPTTRKFVVVDISHNYSDGGLTTTIGLRSSKPADRSAAI